MKFDIYKTIKEKIDKCKNEAEIDSLSSRLSVFYLTNLKHSITSEQYEELLNDISKKKASILEGR